MAEWTSNVIMWWDDNGTLRQITDHNRAPLNEAIERIENKQRMADGTLRRYTVAKKRTWSTSWSNLPSTNTKIAGITTADGGWAGEDIENFHNNKDDAFKMVLRRGSALNVATPNWSALTDAQLPYRDDNFYIVKVMISDFSKEIARRGIVDFWNLDITLEEV